MNSQQLKDIWFYSNALLVANYSLFLISKLVTLPIPKLPSVFNNLFLIVAYVFTFQSLFSTYKTTSAGSLLNKVFTHSNTFCIFLFLTFPNNLLLFPFYLLSIYHVVSTVLSKKTQYEKYFFYSLCVSLQPSLIHLGRAALIAEVAMTVLALLLFIIRKASFSTLVAYVSMVRMQYQSNKSMKEVVDMVLSKLHTFALKMPDSCKDYYFKCINLTKYFSTNKDIKKKQE